MINARSTIGLMPKSASFDLINEFRSVNREDSRRMSHAVDGAPINRKPAGRRGVSTPKPSVNFLKRELNRRLNANHLNGEKESESEIHQNQMGDTKMSQKNPLADRVINWLDLAGLNTLIRIENNSTEKTIPVRRVCTTESVTQRQSLKNGTCFSAPLRRSESVHMLSLTFNDIDGSINQTPSETPFQSFSSAYRANRTIQAASHQNSTNNKTTRHSALSTDSTRGLFGARSRPIGSTKQTLTRKTTSSANATNNEEIEKQYRSLIQRQILEKSCNIQAARRQLHIFMPSLPDKSLLAAPGGGLGVEDGNSSLLSTILSGGK